MPLYNPTSATTTTSGVVDLLTGDSATFAASNGSWAALSTGAISWDNTTKIDGAAGSLKKTVTGNGQGASLALTGTFVAGTEYHAVVYIMVEQTKAVGTVNTFAVVLGSSGTPADQGENNQPDLRLDMGDRGRWVAFLVPWVPTANRTDAQLYVKSLNVSGTTQHLHIGAARVVSVPADNVGLRIVTTSAQAGAAWNDMAPLVVPITPQGSSNFSPFPSPGNPKYAGLSQDQNGGIQLNASAAADFGFLSLYPGAADTGLGGGNGVNLEVGPDGVGLYISEKNATTLQIYDDAGGSYDVELVDQGTKHFKSVGTNGSKNLNDVYVSGGTDVPVTDGGTGSSTAANARTALGLAIGTDVRAQGSGDPTRASLGLATSDTPQFAGIEVGHASDTTITRVSAGVIAVEGVTIISGSGVTVADEGTPLSTTGTTLDFVGAGVVASGTGATKTITVSGGGSGITVDDEGTPLSTVGTTLDFVGAGVTASGTGATKTITIPGGTTTASYLGYNTIGGTAFALANSTIYMTQVTPGSNGILTGVQVYLQLNAEGSNPALGFGLWDDSGGSPRHLLAFGGSAGQANVLLDRINGAGGLDARWIGAAIGYLLTSGTPYWIGFVGGSTASGWNGFKDGSGTDVTSAVTTFYQDIGWTTPTVTANKYSIRGVFLATS